MDHCAFYSIDFFSVSFRHSIVQESFVDKQHGGPIYNQAGVGKQFLQQCHNWQVLITTEAFANGKSRWKGNCLC